MSGFEGSFLGKTSRIAAASVLECGVCWWVYDPALGDHTWQIPAGTAFADLPSHWRCPNCDNSQEQFMVVRPETCAQEAHKQPATPAALDTIHHTEKALRDAYTRVCERMRSLPVYNHSLEVQVVGLRHWTQGLVGIVATPWCMNIILLAQDQTARRIEGTSREIEFPSGNYAFTAGHLPGMGALETCSLFSPMDEFANAGIVAEVARHALRELFSEPGRQANTRGLRRRQFFAGGGEDSSERYTR